LPDADYGSRWPSNPLLVAMVWQLPLVGSAFPGAARRKWLEMMAMAFDVAYGLEDAPLPEARPAAAAAPAAAPPAPPAAPKRAAHLVAGCDYYVDQEGYARCDVQSGPDGIPLATPGRRPLAGEVGEEVIYDYRGAARDRATVVWGDDAIGALPGMAFCGPG